MFTVGWLALILVCAVLLVVTVREVLRQWKLPDQRGEHNSETDNPPTEYPSILPSDVDKRRES